MLSGEGACAKLFAAFAFLDESIWSQAKEREKERALAPFLDARFGVPSRFVRI